VLDNSYLELNKEVKSGLMKNKPIVALESTLISHGLPYPENINVAKLSIEAVRKNDCIPATIAIINGKIKVGLNDKEINILGKNNNVHKVSRHNLSIAISNKHHGATTVASSIYIASQLGIKFFATGGIGGVHLGSEKTFDVSADLRELSRTNMFVVCSGAKSILDLDKTHEKLETLGIPRIGFKTNYMPGFWYYQTEKKVDFNFTKINNLVNFLKVYESLDNNSSVLLFNPIPKNKAIKKELIDRWIKDSIKKAKNNSIEGKELTPFLIKEINSLSKNKTLKANIEMIINNALLAGKLARNYKPN
jgi:pseudouridine-5'-phosphate glycosidase|tara:strand:+ start:721 stop:1638 length:918 start_codon:yes stop_codon:yes gene_type:complete